MQADHKAITAEAASAVGTQASTFDTAAPAGTAAPMLAGTSAASVDNSGSPTGAAQNAPSGQNTPATLPAAQVALGISRNAGDGTQSFTMQLKPEKLGSVEVKLDVDAKGKATASFVADRPETLALLRQDAHHLVKSLNDAGVSTDAGSLNFSLRSNSGESFSEAQERRNSGQGLRDTAYGGQAETSPEPSPAAYQSSGTSRLYDIRA
ncbi:MAG: flagellar hook-length control protein FliK [Aliidongia sp.]